MSEARPATLLDQLPQSARLTDACSGQSMDLVQIRQLVSAWQHQLATLGSKRIVLLSPGNLEWALLDLACIDANLVLVPLPTFISQAQFDHVLALLQPDLIIGSSEFSPAVGGSLQLTAGQFQPAGQFRQFWLYQSVVRSTQVELPAGCQKITFTSGSTGTPKGVCLSAASQWQVAQSLVGRIALAQPRHLAVLPLSTLLENIAGIYAPLLAGGEVLLTDEANRGFAGSALAEPALLLQLISSTRPDSLILVPELLQLLVLASQRGWQAPDSLRFIAVGGAKVAPALLQQAAAVGLPVFQGYGLSECGSVVALSTQHAASADTLETLQSVGQPLPHLQVRITAGELWVKTPFLGYLGAAEQATAPADWVATGDLAELDAKGELRILGRKKNLLISSFGRNIHPEWVEAELLKNALLQQAVVFGDAQPYCVALLYCQDNNISDQQIEQWLAAVNRSLPDYARLQQFHRLTQPLTAANGCLTTNQRPKRDVIANQYAAELAAMYPAVGSIQGSISAVGHSQQFAGV